MGKRMIADMRAGEPVDDLFLLGACDLRTARNDSLYLDLTLSDRSGSIKGRLWDASEALHRALAVGDIVRVKGRLGVYRNELQLSVNVIAKADTSQANLTDFLPAATRPTADMHKELVALLTKEVRDMDYKRLLRAFLDDEPLMAQFCSAPAATAYHHAYLGGLLEHTLSMMNAALLLTQNYPMLRKDVLLTSVFLHDIGKVRELRWDNAFTYTDAGQLVGHIVEGVVMVGEKAAALPDLPSAKVDLIRHAIISHHGSPEFGAPRPPMTAEALALHYLDNLDAKLRDFTQAVADDVDETSSFTPYIRHLERRLYKK